VPDCKPATMYIAIIIQYDGLNLFNELFKCINFNVANSIFQTMLLMGRGGGVNIPLVITRLLDKI